MLSKHLPTSRRKCLQEPHRHCGLGRPGTPRGALRAHTCGAGEAPGNEQRVSVSTRGRCHLPRPSAAGDAGALEVTAASALRVRQTVPTGAAATAPPGWALTLGPENPAQLLQTRGPGQYRSVFLQTCVGSSASVSSGRKSKGAQPVD